MSNKKFFTWLIVGNVIFVVIMITLAFVFIDDYDEERFFRMGQGVGVALGVLNVGIILLYFFWFKKRKG